jgi:glucan phosphoethanolaminetransferase (alkaline phosphatase superfamily)
MEMLGIIIKELRGNRAYIISCALLSVYALGAFIAMSGTKRQLFVAVSCVVLLFLIGCLGRYIFSIMFVFSIIVSGVLSHVEGLWGAHGISSRVQAAYLSPKHEALEYLANYGSAIDVILLAQIMIGLLCLVVLHKKIKPKLRYIRGGALLIACVFYAFLWRLEFPAKMVPYVLISEIIEAGKWKSNVNDRLVFMAEFEGEIPPIKNSKPYEKVVIVIGESVNRAHLASYGYNLNTTPFLESYLKQEHTYKFDNVISPANQTRYAVPISLSDAQVDDFSLFNKSPSLVTTLKKAGYKAYWLSNQYSAGKHDSFIATMASEADVSITANFAYESGGAGDAAFDDVLLSYVDSLADQRVDKEVFFFHLLGSHFQYKKRYPVGSGLYDDPKDIVQEYDNSIYYSDFVLGEIYKRFANYNTLFVYTSDHGEVVNNSIHGHGFLRPSYKGEYEVPLIIGSDGKNDRLHELHRVSQGRQVNTSQLNRLIRHIIGFEEELNLNRLFDSNVIAIDSKNIVNYSGLPKAHN